MVAIQKEGDLLETVAVLVQEINCQGIVLAWLSRPAQLSRQHGVKRLETAMSQASVRRRDSV